MPNASRPLRLLLIAVLALAAAAVLWALIGVLHGAISLWQALRDLPGWAQTGVVVVLALFVLGLIGFGWRLMHPRPRRSTPVTAPTRGEIDQRVARLEQRRTDTAALRAELEELDRRAQSEELYVAVFGEISAGKSSLIRALSANAKPQTDVLGGTTRAVEHYRGTQYNGRSVTFADVPGTHEVAGAAREQLARDEALRAHVVIYLCAGDLTRDQDSELHWLRGFGKPLLLVLNKADQFGDGERAVLASSLLERYGDQTDAQLVLSAGGSETFERRLPDGRLEHVRRDRLPDVAALSGLLERFAAQGASAFESARSAAVLTAVGARADSLESTAREQEAGAIVTKYTRRAVVGAMAAVMPGSDLVIQGVLAAALIRELAKLYGVPLRDLDLDAFLGQVTLTVRTSASIVLAIAGNALKAFPGLGTLGGGVLHAIAYGLIFDSLGRAVATTLRDQHALDAAQANASLARLLADSSAARLRRIVAMAFNRDSTHEADADP
jgi:uncharacterized protein